jgi:FkbM family methyltransferase
MDTIRVNHRWELKVPDIRVNALPWSIWEQHRLDAMYKTIRKGDYIVDIGTEFGDMTALYAKWCGYGSNMILVEPSENYWVYIKSIFEANGIEPPKSSFVGFVGAVNNYQKYPEGYPDEVNGDFTIEGDKGFGFRHMNEQDDTIPTITIDEIYKKEGIGIFPSVVNMDIEGAEYQALLGAKETIEHHRPIWFISVHPEFMWDRYHNTKDDLIHLMELSGYETTYLGKDHEEHFMFKTK